MEIIAEMLSTNGLQKKLYKFKMSSAVLPILEYYGYSEYNRDSVEEPWGHDWPKPPTFYEWTEQNDLDPHDQVIEYKYLDFIRKFKYPNACKTQSGKPVELSKYGSCDFLPKIDKSIADKAIRVLKNMDWKVYPEV